MSLVRLRLFASLAILTVALPNQYAQALEVCTYPSPATIEPVSGTAQTLPINGLVAQTESWSSVGQVSVVKVSGNWISEGWSLMIQDTVIAGGSNVGRTGKKFVVRLKVRKSGDEVEWKAISPSGKILTEKMRVTLTHLCHQEKDFLTPFSTVLLGGWSSQHFVQPAIDQQSASAPLVSGVLGLNLEPFKLKAGTEFTLPAQSGLVKMGEAQVWASAGRDWQIGPRMPRASVQLGYGLSTLLVSDGSFGYARLGGPQLDLGLNQELGAQYSLGLSFRLRLIAQGISPTGLSDSLREEQLQGTRNSWGVWIKASQQSYSDSVQGVLTLTTWALGLSWQWTHSDQ